MRRDEPAGRRWKPRRSTIRTPRSGPPAVAKENVPGEPRRCRDLGASCRRAGACPLLDREAARGTAHASRFRTGAATLAGRSSAPIRRAVRARTAETSLRGPKPARAGELQTAFHSFKLGRERYAAV